MTVVHTYARPSEACSDDEFPDGSSGFEVELSASSECIRSPERVSAEPKDVGVAADTSVVGGSMGATGPTCADSVADGGHSVADMLAILCLSWASQFAGASVVRVYMKSGFEQRHAESDELQPVRTASRSRAL